MNKELITKRLEELEAIKANVLKTIEQGQRDLVAIDGAVQDCNYWLTKLDDNVMPITEIQALEAIAEIKPKRGRKKKAA